jgi:hypothetical protein
MWNATRTMENSTLGGRRGSHEPTSRAASFVCGRACHPAHWAQRSERGPGATGTLVGRAASLVSEQDGESCCSLTQELEERPELFVVQQVRPQGFEP